MTKTSGQRRWASATRVLAILALAAALGGCDKCGDYFWIDSGTPHSCKEVAAPK